MFTRYYAGGFGHWDSAAVEEVTPDSAEAVYESPEVRLGIEDTEGESDDNSGTDDQEESTDEGTGNVH